MRFKAFAGNMFVGYLSVVPGFSHNFISRSNQVVCHRYALGRVAGYKQLRLERV